MIDPIKQIIIVRLDLINDPENPMTIGKTSAQVAHASIAPILEKMRGVEYSKYKAPLKNYQLVLDMKKGEPLTEWFEKDFRKIVLYVKSEEKLIKMHETFTEAGFISCLIEDKGLTVFNQPTITCLGLEPLPHSVIHPFVKRLRLLA